MRGGAQAHLIEASDGHCYVVKFLNNPQHRRILVNEWIASTFLHYLGIAAPEVAMVAVTEEFLAENPDVSHPTGYASAEPVTPGWHFGSRFPGDPARTVVYDFLPDTLLAQVENLRGVSGGAGLRSNGWATPTRARRFSFARGFCEWPPGR